MYGARNVLPGVRDRPYRLPSSYAGRKAYEIPVRLRLEGHEYMVEELLDQWYGPQDVFYKIRADDGNLYILRQQTSAPDKPWDLVSFRRLADDH